jgi:hypothetical protein
MIDTLIEWIQMNPNKDKNIEQLSIKVISDTNEAEPTPEIGPGQVSIIPLDPPGPVSLYLWHTNAEYRAGSFQTRKTVLRETLVMLHERFQNELKGRGWNRKKAIEELESLDTSAVSPQQSLPDLAKALTYIYGFQYAEIDENAKRILTFPKDVRTWSKEYPIYLASYGCRSVYVRTGVEEARTFFNSWFFELIDKNYKYDWPTTEATVKELKEMLSEYNLSLSAKAKKDEYCAAVGKAQAIRHINNEFL